VIMKKKQPISKDEAMILLQSQPLSANLWRIVSENAETNFIRFPDPSFIDSQSWPSYISKKQKATVKTIEQTKEEEVISEIEKEYVQRIEEDKAETKIENTPTKLKEPLVKEIIPPEFVDDINNNESQPDEVKVEEVVSKVAVDNIKSDKEIERASADHNEEQLEKLNQPESVNELESNQSQQVDMSEKEKLKDTYPEEEISIPVSQTKRKRSTSKSNAQPEKDMQPTYSDSLGSEATVAKTKATGKSLDFYEWLEELKLPDAPEVKKPRTRKVKARTVDKDLEETKMIAENSLKLGEEIVSETLARLLARQGHREEAIEMYQKLILKYPEKEATFAAALQKLKS
jgi:hypothetical protein